jgi:hypothetical protein
VVVAIHFRSARTRDLGNKHVYLSRQTLWSPKLKTKLENLVTLSLHTMASFLENARMSASNLPPDLFDRTTLVSLAATVVLVLTAYTTSLILLRRSVGPALRFLFVWHLADALCHFVLEGSFLYHCFFSYVPVSEVVAKGGVRALAGDWFPTPFNWLGTEGRLYGPQAGGDGFFAQLWMVYARADKRWAGVDLVRLPFCSRAENFTDK